MKEVFNKNIWKPIQGSWQAVSGRKLNIYTNLAVVGLLFLALIGYISFQVADKNIAFLAISLSFILGMLINYLVTRKGAKEEYAVIINRIKEDHLAKIKRLRNEHDTSTLEKTIRDGTRTLIKNAVDYFKIENIKNEMPASAAIQNLQLDKYGQIIELLADFSLILPDYKENQEIVQQELNHQIEIYQIDEKAFAVFLQRIMEKYEVTVSKKLRERIDNTAPSSMKTCPRCAERVLPKAKVCKHCGHEFAAGSEKQQSSEMEVLKKGQALYRSGDYQEALKVLTNAIKDNPKFGQAYYNRGILHEKLGNQTQALNDLTAAAQLGHKKAQKFLLSYMDTQEFPFRPT